MRISTLAKEGPFQGAKWLKIQALLDPDELEDWVRLISPFFLFPFSGAFALEKIVLDPKAFTLAYRSWIESLKKGNVPEITKPFQATLWTKTEESVWLQEVSGDRFLIKPSAPFLLVQAHHMGYSSGDHRFHPMSFSPEAIFWGLQFSFPQAYQRPDTLEIIEREEGPNTALFQTLRRWIREFTSPTPMMVEGNRINLPIRIGKKCFSWVNDHPQLKERGLQVKI